MSNSKFKIGNLSGKGLIIAAAACVLAVGAAGYYSYTTISNRLNSQLIGSNSDTFSAGADEENGSEAPVDIGQTNIAKEEETTVSTVTEPPAESVNAVTEISEGTETTSVSTQKTEENNIPQAMVRPLNGEVINIFSDGELVKSKTLNVWKTHDGVDIAGAPDEKVKSMTSGTVKSVSEDQLLGVCVIIDHGNGLEGYYCSLSKDVPVAEGQSVSAGTIIGTVGNTAESEVSEDSHLHFAVKKNGEWIDPIALISGEGS